MRTNIIYLSELIEGLEKSVKKIPKVPNYHKINDTLLPYFKKMYSEQGDVDIPADGFIKAMLTPLP